VKTFRIGRRRMFEEKAGNSETRAVVFERGTHGQPRTCQENKVRIQLWDGKKGKETFRRRGKTAIGLECTTNLRLGG